MGAVNEHRYGELTGLVKKISILLLVFTIIGAASFYYLNSLKGAQGTGEEFSRSAATQCSQKLSELASPPKTRSPKTLEFSQKEIDSFLHYEVSQYYPQGLRQVRVKLLDGSLTANAKINFDEIQSAENPASRTWISTLFRGEHTVEATGKIETNNGSGSYDILGVRLDQKEIPRPLVNLLITKLVLPKYPEAKPNSNFELPYEINRIEISPGRLVVHQSGS
jgi:hypothetical protein